MSRSLSEPATLSPFTRAYVETALWSSTDDDGDPLDVKYGLDAVAPDALAKAADDCNTFREAFGHLLTRENVTSSYPPDEQAGHDFWLTRCGHGSGFWDGDWRRPAADELTRGAKAFGEAELYVGDDGMLHFM